MGGYTVYSYSKGGFGPTRTGIRLGQSQTQYMFVTEIIPSSIMLRLETKIKSIMFRAKVRTFLLEVVLDLLHPILDLQVDLRLLKMVPNDSPYPKTLGLIPKSSL